MFKGKRGISPLVATVLLIAFSVALGAVVMSWGESYIEQRADFVSGRPEVGGACDTALVSIITVKDVPQACVRGNTIELFIENGNQPIDGIKAQVVGSDSLYVAENILTGKLEAAGAIKITITPGTIGQIKQVKLIPIVVADGQKQFCEKSQTKLEDLRSC